MKKFVVLSLVAILILAFGATVYGQEKKEAVLEFKPFGFIDAQTFWWNNVTIGNAASGIYNTWSPGTFTAGLPSGALDRKNAYLESRARLGFNMIMGKEVSGTFLFEMDSTTWGDTPGGQGGVISERNTYGYWGGDRAAVEIKNIYLDFGIPVIPVPITVRVGEQTFGLRTNLLLLTDGIGVTAGIKLDPVLIAPMWGKPLEGARQTADDVNLYGLHANAKIGTLTIGGYGLYYNMNTYPFFVATTSYGAPYPNIGITRLAQGTMAADMWWLGAYVDGKLGPVNLNFDFIYDTGKVKERWTPNIPDVKYSGWATRVAVDYPIEKLNIGLVGAYGSGSDTRKTSSSGLPGSATSSGINSSKVGSYVVPVGSETGAAFGESIVVYSSWVNRGDSGIATSLNYNQLNRGGIGGTWFAKLYAGYKVIPEYKVTFQGLYIGDTTKNGDTFGTSRTAPFGTADLRDKSDIGIEVDLINEIQIYKNLKYTIAGGYLFAGKALDLSTGAGLGNYGPDNPWQITTNLTYNF
jgi:hypothetical protein